MRLDCTILLFSTRREPFSSTILYFGDWSKVWYERQGVLDAMEEVGDHLEGLEKRWVSGMLIRRGG